MRDWRKLLDRPLSRRFTALATAAAVLAPAFIFVPPFAVVQQAEAWFPHGTGGGPAHTYPAPGPGLNVFLSAIGSDSNDGLAGVVGGGHGPWLTINKCNTALASATGSVTVNLRSGDTFTCPTANGLLQPAGVSAWQVQSDYTGGNPAIILANNSGTTPCVATGANSTIIGPTVQGDYLTIYGLNTSGNGVTVQHCKIGGFVYASIVTNNTTILIDSNVIGGVNPASTDANGIFMNPGTSLITVTNNNIQYMGATNATNPTDSGMGIHVATAPVGGIQPLLYTAGVPTNALITIRFNVVHDCAGNIQASPGGGPSLIELGDGDRMWCADNICYNINPLTGITGSIIDFDGIDAGDNNATNSLVERNFVYNCAGGGIITFAGHAPPNWGPVVVRYNLILNCGLLGGGNVGNVAIQDLNNGGAHFFYNNTIIQIASANAMPGSLYNLNYFDCASATGVVGNNAIYTIYPYFMVQAASGSNTGLKSTNNGWFGNAPFDWSGTQYATYALIKAAAPAGFDVNGVSGNDPGLANQISSISWSGGTVTVGLVNPHGLVGAQSLQVTGVTVAFIASAYEGTFVCTPTGANTFTYPLASNPGTATTPGMWVQLNQTVLGVTGILNSAFARLAAGSPCLSAAVNLKNAPYNLDTGSTDFFGGNVTGGPVDIGCQAV